MRVLGILGAIAPHLLLKGLRREAHCGITDTYSGSFLTGMSLDFMQSG